MLSSSTQIYTAEQQLQINQYIFITPSRHPKLSGNLSIYYQINSYQLFSFIAQNKLNSTTFSMYLDHGRKNTDNPKQQIELAKPSPCMGVDFVVEIGEGRMYISLKFSLIDI